MLNFSMFVWKCCDFVEFLIAVDHFKWPNNRLIEVIDIHLVWPIEFREKNTKQIPIWNVCRRNWMWLLAQLTVLDHEMEIWWGGSPLVGVEIQRKKIVLPHHLIIPPFVKVLKDQWNLVTKFTVISCNEKFEYTSQTKDSSYPIWLLNNW